MATKGVCVKCRREFVRQRGRQPAAGPTCNRCRGIVTIAVDVKLVPGPATEAPKPELEEKE